MSSQPARVIQFPVCPAEMACMPASIPLDLSDPVPQSPYVSVAARKGVVLLRPTGPHLNHREAGIVLQEGREALERHGAGPTTAVAVNADRSGFCRGPEPPINLRALSA